MINPLLSLIGALSVLIPEASSSFSGIDSEHKTNFKVPELIPEGKRVDTIVRLIASLRTKGLDDDAIKAAVRVENEKRCNPPLKEKELEKAVFPALKRDWQVNSPYYNNFNAMNENDNKYWKQDSVPEPQIVWRQI